MRKLGELFTSSSLKQQRIRHGICSRETRGCPPRQSTLPLNTAAPRSPRRSAPSIHSSYRTTASLSTTTAPSSCPFRRQRDLLTTACGILHEPSGRRPLHASSLELAVPAHGQGSEPGSEQQASSPRGRGAAVRCRQTKKKRRLQSVYRGSRILSVFVPTIPNIPCLRFPACTLKRAWLSGAS